MVTIQITINNTYIGIFDAPAATAYALISAFSAGMHSDVYRVRVTVIGR